MRWPWNRIVEQRGRIAEGRFRSQIVPIVKQTKKGEVIFDTDEHVKPNTTMETPAKMKPAFKKDGSVTAGNASGINHGAAFFVLADRSGGSSGRLQADRTTGLLRGSRVPNEIMGEGPIPATKLALKKGGLMLDQMDAIESNEAFAAQAIAVARALEFDMEKTNRRRRDCAGSSDRLLRCLSRFLATKAVYQFQRIGGH